VFTTRNNVNADKRWARPVRECVYA